MEPGPKNYLKAQVGNIVEDLGKEHSCHCERPKGARQSQHFMIWD